MLGDQGTAGSETRCGGPARYAVGFGLLALLVVLAVAFQMTAHSGGALRGAFVSAEAQPIANGANDEVRPAMAYSSQAGAYLVVWTEIVAADDQDIVGRRVGPDGVPVGSATPIAWEGTRLRLAPALAYNPAAGEYLVAWEQEYSPSDHDIYARRVDGNGAPLGAEIPVAIPITVERDPAVACGPSGQCLVVWSGDDGTYQRIYGQRLAPDGTPFGEPIAIGSASNIQWSPAVAHDPASGQYLVVWQHNLFGDENFDIHGRRVADDGSLLGEEIAISTWEYDQVRPRLAFNASTAQFLVVWEDHHWGWGDDWDVYGQRVNPDGSLAGGSFAISWDGPEHRESPDVAYKAAVGEYLVAWEYEARGDDHDVYCRRVLGDGTLPDAEVPLSILGSFESRPALASDQALAYLVAWEDDRDGVSQGINIYGEIVALQPPPIPTSTPTPTSTPYPTPIPTPVGKADLLIIAPESFTPPLRALVDHKNETGMPAHLITLEWIEGHYSGYDLPEKIKYAIEEEHRLYEVQYVMLVGDTDVFPVRWAYVCIPTAPLPCASGFPWRFSGGYVAADLYYADLYEANGMTFETWDFDMDHKYGENGCNWCTGANADQLDLSMDVIVGRLPASKLEEVTTYVNKVIRYEYTAGYGGAWTRRGMIVAGYLGGTIEEAKKIAAEAPSLKTTILAYATPPMCAYGGLATRENINAQFDSGVLLAVYTGHGAGPTVWGIGALCNGTTGRYDVPYEIIAPNGPDNKDRLPVVLAFACENGRYGAPIPWALAYLDVNGIPRDYSCNPPCFPTPLEPEEPAPVQMSSAGVSYDRESTAEWFLVASDDGAVAEIATYGYGDGGNFVMGETFFRTYEHGERILGELWKVTFDDFITRGNVDNHWHFRHLTGYHLFGDPSLRVGGVGGLLGMPPEVTVSGASADGSIYSSDPDGNYGTNGSFAFLNYPGDYMARALISFTLPAIPPSSTIKMANLDQYVLTADPAATWNELYELQDAWQETTVTWNNSPLWSIPVFHGTIAAAQFTYMTRDVAASVDRWVNQGVPNNGWLMRGDEDSGYIYSFAAREHSDYPHPLLVIKHQPPCPAKVLLGVLLSSLGVDQGGLETLYRLRDELLVATPRGQQFIDLFYRHSLEMSALFLFHDDVRAEGAATLGLFLPGLEALVNGQGETVVVTQEMVDSLDLFLTHLHSLAGPEFQADIAGEWERVNPPGLVGLTFAEAWQRVSEQLHVYLPLLYRPAIAPPAPEALHFTGYVYLGEIGNTTQPLAGVQVALQGAGGRFGPVEVLSAVQTGADGSFALTYEYIPEPEYGYYNLAISDTRYVVVGVAPGSGGEPWEPGWIQFVSPPAGAYLENAFFVQPAGR